MKQIHNVRLRIIDVEQEVIKTFFSTILSAAGIKPEDAKITVQNDGTDEVFNGELWLDHQQPVRKFLKLLQEKLPKEQQATITVNPAAHIDTQTHCFLRLNKKRLLEGEWTLAEKEESCMLRLNIAAFPASKENAEKIVKELFS